MANAMKASKMTKTATLYRNQTPQSTCPHGLKAKTLLESEGFTVIDTPLTSRDAIDAFKAKHDVATTPQVFIDGERIGGSDDLALYLGKAVQDKDAPTYTPVIALFAVAALLAVAVTWVAAGTVFKGQTIACFIAIAMVLLGLQKLQDIEKFSGMFLTYDLLAGRYPRYAYIYPFIEAGAGLLMLAGVLTWLSAPITLVAAGIGAVSVIKAVYIDKRSLQCACLGDSRVPLGFVSLTENLMMIGMAVWMLSTLI